MSVDNFTDEASGGSAADTDFETEIKRVAAIMMQAINQGRDDQEACSTHSD